MANVKTKPTPRYSFSFRYTEDVRQALKKIMKQEKCSQNKAVEQAILAVAKSSIIN